MRITTEAKLATRKRLLEVTGELLRSQGFEETTIRAIARRAEIASGTFFNYFPSKEAIVVELVAVELEKARVKFHKLRPAPRTLEEALFALIALELRHLRQYRSLLSWILPLIASTAEKAMESAEQIRTRHLKEVAQVGRQFKIKVLPLVAQQLYWTLYIGILTSWMNDSSPKQEDTFALIDQSISMYVAWLTNALD